MSDWIEENATTPIGKTGYFLRQSRPADAKLAHELVKTVSQWSQSNTILAIAILLRDREGMGKLIKGQREALRLHHATTEAEKKAGATDLLAQVRNKFQAAAKHGDEVPDGFGTPEND